MAKRESARGGKGYRDRRVAVRSEIPSFLIVSEGVETEPNYFRAFRMATVDVVPVGLGVSALRLVKKAIDLRERDRKRYE